jgi:N-acyl-D-amino-acid deacylase
MDCVQRDRAPPVPGVLLIARGMRNVDLLVRGGTIYDGNGQPPKVGDVAIKNDRIAAVGDVGRVAAHHVIDADGLAVAPGFINR